MTPVMLEPTNPRSPVKQSTTEPLHSLVKTITCGISSGSSLFVEKHIEELLAYKVLIYQRKQSYIRFSPSVKALYGVTALLFLNDFSASNTRLCLEWTPLLFCTYALKA